MPYFVYIVRCRDGTLYTGYTNNLAKRIATHNAGKWAKYTRGRIPVEIVYFEQYDNKNMARKRENEIKKMKKDKKILLIKSLSRSLTSAYESHRDIPPL